MPTEGDSVSVAVGGSLPRRDECEQCGQPMLYWVNEQAVPASKFCQNMACARAFLVSPIDGQAGTGPEGR
jgi:hypothetical protein